jgi:uncharacterized glyoxalase superfamily protein PhnB
MSVKKITAVLLVEEIEPCLEFWTRLNFRKTIEVPNGDRLVFVTLESGNSEVMYQTFSSVDKSAQAFRRGPTFLYIEVDDLEKTIAAIKGAPVVMPVRTTFYGAKEIGVTEASGHVITFAQMGFAPGPSQ